MNIEKNSYKIFMIFLFSIILFLNLIPVYQITVNAFKSPDDYNGAGIYEPMGVNVFMPPRALTLFSFSFFFNETAAIRAFLNNVILSVFCVIVLEILGTITALILTQYQVRFTNQIVRLLIGGQAIPIVMTILTTFLVSRSLHFLDTYHGAIIALSAQFLPFTILIFYSYYQDLPKELLAAAEVDGASFLQVFRMIVLPMSGTILATVGILIFIFTWATYLIGLVLLRKENMQILSMVIQNMEINMRLRPPAYFAAFVIFSLPMIVVARWAQRYISTGMLAGAMKE